MDSKGRHKASLGAGLTQGKSTFVLTNDRERLVCRVGENVHEVVLSPP